MRSDEFPTTLQAWSNGVLELPPEGTHFGYVFSGTARIECKSGFFDITQGMYFAIPGSGSVRGHGHGIIVSRYSYFGFFQIGGPIEPDGRLRYIDSCTDSLLIPPIEMGDACLNLLCFHAGVDQTPHTHPSMRVGIVVDGTGLCRAEDEEIPLTPGQAFIIPAGQIHAFATRGSTMRIIAYHPDSDFGPTHHDHPMINRTIVNGVSAAKLEHLHTK